MDRPAVDKFGNAPLHYASSLDEAKSLLESGANVSHHSHCTGWTPLHTAAYNNKCDIVKLYLDYGADPNARGHAGETPLHMLVALEHSGNIERSAIHLLSAGAKINTQDDAGNSPLHWALGALFHYGWEFQGNINSALFLIQHNANPRLKNHHKISPFVLSMRMRRDKSIYNYLTTTRGLNPTISDYIMKHSKLKMTSHTPYGIGEFSFYERAI